MDFNLSAEQQLLRDSVTRFVRERHPFKTRRTIANGATGYSDGLWSAMAELGWLALNVPEDQGGLGAPMADTLVLMQGLGEGLVAEPVINTGVWAACLLAGGEGAAVRRHWLEAIASGAARLVVAHRENGRSWQSLPPATRARRDGDGYVLGGQKIAVFDAPVADALLVTAAEEGQPGLAVFLVERNTPGLVRDDYRLVDGTAASDLTLLNCRVPAANRLLAGEEGAAVFAAASDRAHLAVLATLAGLMEGSLELAADYARTRRQFGQPIGAFQAIQHLLADMFVACQESQSILFHALAAIDSPDASQRQRALSAAAVVMGEGLRFVTEQGIQLHGGYGVTDEYAISHYHRRGLVLAQWFGDGDEHLARFSRLAPEGDRRHDGDGSLLRPGSQTEVGGGP